MTWPGAVLLAFPDRLRCGCHRDCNPAPECDHCVHPWRIDRDSEKKTRTPIEDAADPTP